MISKLVLLVLLAAGAAGLLYAGWVWWAFRIQADEVWE